MGDSISKPDRYSHPGKAGRKPKLTTLVNRALTVVDKRLPDIFQALIEKALEGDRDAMIYLIDRRLGKPKATTEIELPDKLGAGMVVEFFKIIAERDKDTKQIGGRYAIQGQDEGSRGNEALQG